MTYPSHEPILERRLTPRHFLLACPLLLGFVVNPGDPPPRIQRPDQSVVQRGTTSTIEIRGANLGQTERAIFDGPGGLVTTIRSKGPDRVRLDVRTAPDATVGERELRLATPGGMSNAVAIHVDVLPVSVEQEPNDTPGDAQPITLPATICGTIHKAAQRDCFRFRAARGEDVVFEIRARRLGSGLDPEITVRDSDGRTIAWGEPGTSGDPRLSFSAPNAGEFDLVVRDVRFRGDKRFYYQLRAGTLPLAGKRDGAKSESESEPNNRLEDANTLHLPIAVGACIDRRGDVDVFRFRVDTKTTLVLGARAVGSPLDPLLILADAKGKRLKVDDDSGAGNDSRIRHSFAKGTYTATVRSLVGHGGTDHTYVLTIAPPAAKSPDFAVRCRPDTARLSRGSSTKMWCEVVRRAGFKGDVTLSFQDLPRGVSCAPVELTSGNGWTSVFALTAAADAELGSTPLKFDARATLDGQFASRTAIPEARGGTRRRAWLTVLERASFTVAPFGRASASAWQAWATERAELEQRLRESPPGLKRERQQLQAAHHKGHQWITLEANELRSKQGSSFQKLEDGSVLLKGKAPDKDAYTFVAKTSLAAIAAIRLDVLPHESLPGGGPGRHRNNGNFVLNRLIVTTAPASKPDKATPVVLLRAKARFSQRGFGAARAFDGNTGTGWATMPRSGKANFVIFEPKTPIANPGGTILKVTMDQQFGTSHVIGRFRLSVASKRLSPATTRVPPAIDTSLRAADRTAAQAAKIAVWFRTVAPSFARIHARIAEIDGGRGNQAKIEVLQKQLRADTPELTAARARWAEETAKRMVQWTELRFTELRSERGVRFVHQPDNVVRARRPVADKDNYTLVAETKLSGITAIRLEALPHKELPRRGPGLAPNGNFVLSDISLSAWPTADPTAAANVRLHSPIASFEQGGYPIRGTLDGSHPTGWGILGNVGKTNFGLWKIKNPIVHAGGSVLRLYLEHQSRNKRHQLGLFRISVTAAKNPSLSGQGLPIDVAQILTHPAARRSAKDQRRLAAYYRQIAPELQRVRERITVLRAEQSAYPPTLRRGKRGTLAVRIARRKGFTGPVEVTLEGFSSGREKDRRPRSIASSLTVKPVTLAPNQDVAIFEIQARPNSELGTRSVVVRAAGKVGKQTVVEYSAPIPLTVAK